MSKRKCKDSPVGKKNVKIEAPLKDPLEGFNKDLVFEIFSSLPLWNLFDLRNVCSAWRKSCKDYAEGLLQGFFGKQNRGSVVVLRLLSDKYVTDESLVKTFEKCISERDPLTLRAILPWCYKLPDLKKEEFFLSYACWMGFDEVVELLFRVKGIDLERNGKFALQRASVLNRLKIVEMFLNDKRVKLCARLRWLLEGLVEHKFLFNASTFSDKLFSETEEKN